MPPPTNKKDRDFDLIFEVGNLLLNKAHKMLQLTVEPWELKKLLDELNKFASRLEKRWLRSKRLKPDDVTYVKVLLLQINNSAKQILEYKTKLEGSVYFRVRELDEPGKHNGKARDLQSLAYWSQDYSQTLFEKMGLKFSETGEE